MEETASAKALGRHNKGARTEGVRQRHAYDKLEQSVEDSSLWARQLDSKFVLCSVKPHAAFSSTRGEQELNWGDSEQKQAPKGEPRDSGSGSRCGPAAEQLSNFHFSML